MLRRLVVASLALAFLAVPAQAEDTRHLTIAEILAAQGDGPDRNAFDFDILAAVVGVILEANPDSPLALAADPDAELTVFAPNDLAFRFLAADLIDRRLLFKRVKKVLAALANTFDAATLELVVLYHVVPGFIDSRTALHVPKGTELDTVFGAPIRVFPKPRFRTAVLADEDPNDPNPFLVRRQLDIEALNGIIHGISLVLRPLDL